MTLDDLEALIWRQLPRIDAATMDTILAAAQAYAIAQYGITAERRAVLAAATDPVTHQVRGGSARSPACGRGGRHSQWAGTHDPVKVTCGACKRTGAYRAALAEGAA